MTATRSGLETAAPAQSGGRLSPVDRPGPVTPPTADGHGLSWIDLLRMGLVAAAIVATRLRLWEPSGGVDIIGLLGTAIGGYPIVKEAFTSLAARRMTMELSMTIALVAALAIGELFTALVIVFFVLVAEALEGLTVGRVRSTIKDLLALLPGTVAIRRDGEVLEIPAETIQPTDRVIVKPGGRIPVDGVVAAGHSFVDQSAITGESLPAEKVAGSGVYAGTINQSGALEISATRLGRDTTFGRIIEAIEQAEQSQAPIQKIADRLAGYLVYCALGAAAVTWLITRDVRATISVVIVAGACGVAVGTPLAIFAAISRAARQRAIVKGGLYMETLGTIDTVVLDKTGTVTFGHPAVTGVYPSSGATQEEVLEAAAIAERPSEHPLAKAVLSKAREMTLSLREPDRFESVPGKGIRCRLGTEEILVGTHAFLEEQGFQVAPNGAGANAASEVFVSRGARVLGTLHLKDTLRPEAIQAVAALRRMGLRIILLTGDATSITNEIANALAVDEVAAELLPDQKLARVRALLDQGKGVVMVGDGINDAPALAQASVGVAMGSGTDVAQESADVVLLGNDLLTLVDVLNVARRCRRIILANFAGTLLVDGLGMALAAVGLLNPLLAAMVHVSSELVFVVNSARLLPSISTHRRRHRSASA